MYCLSGQAYVWPRKETTATSVVMLRPPTHAPSGIVPTSHANTPSESIQPRVCPGGQPTAKNLPHGFAKAATHA